jgi:hypothetical protein
LKVTLTSNNTPDKTRGRRQDRRRYRAMGRQITRAITELYRRPDPGGRAATLTLIAELYDHLAARHIPAYGTTVTDLGNAGQDEQVDALRACADLARLVAGTEAAWHGECGPAVPYQAPGLQRMRAAMTSQADADDLTRLWRDFGDLRDRQQRADLLDGPLYHLALPSAAASLLVRIAESERESARRSAAMTTGQARRRRLFTKLPEPVLMWSLAGTAGVALTKSVPFGLVVIGASVYVPIWGSIGDRVDPYCEPADHWRGPDRPAEFCPACDPAYTDVPYIDTDQVRAWLAGRRHAVCYQTRMLPQRRIAWRAWLRCKATGHRIGTPGHRRAHQGRRCRPWRVWWLPPVPIVHAARGDAGCRDGGDAVAWPGVDR